MTLTQLIARIRAFATAHQQINSFNFGTLPDRESKEGPVYPLLDCYVVSSAVEENTDVIEFSFFLCDQAETTEEVLSDLRTVAKDTVSYFKNTLFTEYLNVEAPVTFTPSESTREDNVYGWTFNLRFQFEGGLDICDTPISEIDLPTPGSRAIAWADITEGLPGDNQALVDFLDENYSSVDFSKNIAPNSTAIQHTGTTSETKIYSILIPGGTIQSGDLLRFLANIIPSGGGNLKTIRWYVNSTDTLPLAGGVQQIACNGFTSQTQTMFRERVMVSGGTTYFMLRTQNSAFDNFANYNTQTARTGVSIDWTIDQYFLISAELSSGAEELYLYETELTIKR